MTDTVTWYYYCEKCQKYVYIIMDSFYHIDEGLKTCFVCRKCGGMVSLQKQEGKYAL